MNDRIKPPIVMHFQRAKDFEILRGVEPNGRKSIPLQRKPVRVATMIDEASFLKDHVLVHNHNVFLEDRLSDWQWNDGKFVYYTRVATQADVLVVYEIEKFESEAVYDREKGAYVPAGMKTES